MDGTIRERIRRMARLWTGRICRLVSQRLGRKCGNLAQALRSPWDPVGVLPLGSRHGFVLPFPQRRSRALYPDDGRQCATLAEPPRQARRSSRSPTRPPVLNWPPSSKVVLLSHTVFQVETPQGRRVRLHGALRPMWTSCPTRPPHLGRRCGRSLLGKPTSIH